MSVTQEKKQELLARWLRLSPVIPVLTIPDAEQAPALARALAAGGARVLEVTLRTPAGLEAIRRIAAEVPDVLVGVGTITTPAELQASERAGAVFAVSPGATDVIIDAADAGSIPLLPGVMTVAEAMRLGERGYRHLKLFPANVAGGIPFLQAIHAPLPQFRFCPTGGINLTNLGDFLRQPNVACVGGSWLATKDQIGRLDWEGITRNAREVQTVAAGVPGRSA
jgi:2-dehydro-3-deoxyphosphogluconate aldolase/(4S)-4-hydroxy-2-oxoglutarate aldolase